MKRDHVLDANALLDFVEAGLGFDKVEQLLQSAMRQQGDVFVSVMNLGEVFYWLLQRRGEEKARAAVAPLLRLPIQFVPVDMPQALKAAQLKVMHKIPYVDCIAAALALQRQATLVTADRDFEKLGRHFPILWIHRS